MKVIITAAALAVLMTTAHAGSNTCEGKIEIGAQAWTRVVTGGLGDYPDGCWFRTNSKLGQRILAICPDQTECMINVMPLDNRSPALTSVSSVMTKEQWERKIAK